MTILLPVISRTVDEVIVDYLLQIQHGQLTSTNGDWNENNNKNDTNSTDENNNNQVEVDDFDELVGDWAEEPWTPCDQVDIPDWAKIQDSEVEVIQDIDENLVWAEDPWTQTPLTDIPDWMRLRGIDYDIPEDATPDNNVADNDEELTDVQNDDEEFITPYPEVEDWAAEKYEQLPLDVPRWALLPGIDYPTRNMNSIYWRDHIEQLVRRRSRFAYKMFTSNLFTLPEEEMDFDYFIGPILCVPTAYGRRWCRL